MTDINVPYFLNQAQSGVSCRSHIFPVSFFLKLFLLLEKTDVVSLLNNSIIKRYARQGSQKPSSLAISCIA